MIEKLQSLKDRILAEEKAKEAALVSVQPKKKRLVKVGKVKIKTKK